jgi:transforming growth factor-beta-induced protein
MIRQPAICLGIFLFLAAACGDGDSNPNTNNDNNNSNNNNQVEETLVDLALGDPRFSTLVEALERAGLVEVLQGEGPFTVFAPTNDAFETAGIVLDEVPVEDLQQILLYHVVAGEVPAGDLSTGAAETVQGGFLVVRVDDGAVTINDATVIQADILADNGVIHAIDAVLLPPVGTVVDVLRGRDEFSTLLGALEATGLDAALADEGPFTLFAPTNEAFEEIEKLVGSLTLEELTAVLLYHVVGERVFSTQLVDGNVPTLLEDADISIDTESLTVNDALLLLDHVDLQGTNGVVHGIDAVLLPE